MSDDLTPARRAALADRMRELGPDRFDMAELAVSEDSYDAYSLREMADNVNRFVKCGTTACLAGTAVLTFPDLAAMLRAVARGPECIETSVVADYLGLSTDAFYRDDWTTAMCQDDEFTVALEILNGLHPSFLAEEYHK